ncbi:hypothetical protein XYCOK13_41550 [Xylanibacillus composti]|uniref:histidine kinase n=1 Tax=Xylanibacillus composti TaxID=1572762 RepID=A0A8J4M4X5_9BACL|nr:sensor histidine kinase [Xylanibacillus composti]GIQ71331.1 hypothetical protein XYCOK13_41550 [Xylanibacillus composti]
MRRIQNQIVLLSVLVWIIMAAIWLLMNAYTQQSINKYNEILSRYMLMNGLAQLSSSAMGELDRYVQAPHGDMLGSYERLREQIEQGRENLYRLRHSRNRIELTNYYYVSESQREEMDRVVAIVRDGADGDYAKHFEEAEKLSQYLQDSAMRLFSTELTTSEQVYREIIQQSEYVMRLGIWILVMSSLILFWLSFRFARSITRPIIELTSAAKDISRGNFNKPISLQGSDEMVFLARTFDRMREDIRNYIEEIRSKAQVEKDLQSHKLLLKESELRHLQSQINPHFLFNSLNILSKKAYLEGAPETCELITSVSNLLRYNLRRSDGTVTIQEELQVLEEYMTIQKARFGERVTYQVRVEPGCSAFVIPALTLQPLVENAFIHAIEPSEEGGAIEIDVADEGEAVCVQVRDTGSGIPEAAIQQALQGRSVDSGKGHSTGIGLGNVIQRLRLYYGQEDIMQITSSSETGSCFTMKLPKGAGLHDQAADRG